MNKLYCFALASSGTCPIFWSAEDVTVSKGDLAMDGERGPALTLHGGSLDNAPWKIGSDLQRSIEDQIHEELERVNAHANEMSFGDWNNALHENHLCLVEFDHEFFSVGYRRGNHYTPVCIHALREYHLHFQPTGKFSNLLRRDIERMGRKPGDGEFDGYLTVEKKGLFVMRIGGNFYLSPTISIQPNGELMIESYGNTFRK